MKAITFSVPGDPVPQPRARITTRGKFAHAYTPKKHPVHAYRDAILREALACGLTPVSEPIEVIIDAVFARPKSHLTKRGVKATAPALPRADVDNVAKACLDSLKDLFDDTNVRRLIVEKSWGDEARTTVRVQ
jgi:Holliday junction resolvase RusA-like endonuclease